MKKPSLRYKQVYDGEWVRPSRTHHRMKCCDCGLVHVINFRVRKGHIEFQAFRHKQATRDARRRKATD
jgi:hypothetical protein